MGLPPLRPLAVAVATIALIGCVSSGDARPAATPAVDILIGTARGEELAFVPSTVAAPAGTAVRITFRNASDRSHNLTFESPISAGSRTIVEAGASDEVIFVTPRAGSYTFVCTIHMGMEGTLSVD
jgi:plastocyanin